MATTAPTAKISIVFGEADPPQAIVGIRFLYEHLTSIRHRRYSSQMIIRARIVVTMHGAPIENGAVAVSGNRIVDVGRFDDIKDAQRR